MKPAGPVYSRRSTCKGTPLAPKPSHPFKTPRHLTRAQLDAMRTASDFQLQFSEDTKREIDDMEKKLKWQRQQLTKEQLEADFKDWIPDSGYSRTRDTKNFKLTEYTRSAKRLLCKLLRIRAANRRA